MKTAPAPTMPAAGGHASGEPRTGADEEVDAAKPQSVPKTEETHTGSAPSKKPRLVGAHSAPTVFLLERATARSKGIPSNTTAAPADTSAVIIAVVSDPERLLSERELGFHGDVVDLLTDLVIDAMDREAEKGPDE